MYAGLKELHHEEEGLLHSFLEPEAFFLVRKVMDALMEGSLDADLLNRESGYGVDSDFTYQHADPEGLNAGLRYILTQCWRYQRSAKPLDSAVVLHKSVVAALRILSEGGWNQSLSRLAARCDVSDGHLSRLFYRQIGVHLSQYRNSLRLARFWDAYRSSENRTITEAAYAAGFGSYAQFYKVFVAAHGQGPKSLAAAR